MSIVNPSPPPHSPSDEPSRSLPPAPGAAARPHSVNTAVWVVALMAMAGGLWLTRPKVIVKTPASVQRTQSCLANLSRIATAFAQYASDYDGQFPRGVDPEDRYNPGLWQVEYGGAYKEDSRTAPMLHDLLFPYLHDKEVWHCPDDTGYDISSLPGFEKGLRNVKPSSYAKYGTSYYYLTLRGFVGRTAFDFADPGRSISLFDGDLWHRPQGRPSVNALFVDGHVQNLLASDFANLMRRDYDSP
jgi:prepilin-type processing-associated H-X9-DG protein